LVYIYIYYILIICHHKPVHHVNGGVSRCFSLVVLVYIVQNARAHVTGIRLYNSRPRGVWQDCKSVLNQDANILAGVRYKSACGLLIVFLYKRYSTYNSYISKLIRFSYHSRSHLTIARERKIIIKKAFSHCSGVVRDLNGHQCNVVVR
jgi:hypothetical protein